jgi:hypothetical protein
MKSVKKEGVAKHIVVEYKKLYAIEGHIKGLPPSLNLTKQNIVYPYSIKCISIKPTTMDQSLLNLL